jgi:hypothetical protein
MGENANWYRIELLNTQELLRKAKEENKQLRKELERLRETVKKTEAADKLADD